LIISSYNSQKLVVWVTANDLRNITAYDNAEVKSFGNLSSIDLEVNLHNTSIATLKMDTYQASITVADHARASLAGNTDDCRLTYSDAAAVNSLNLMANRMVKVQLIENDKKDDADLVIL
jgi:hypothetical protein